MRFYHRWLRDIPSNNLAFKKAMGKGILLKSTYKNLAANFKISKNTAKILVSFLYWCEGSKYPAENRIGFANSDWNLLKIFLELLRKAFDIKEEKLSRNMYGALLRCENFTSDKWYIRNVCKKMVAYFT